MKWECPKCHEKFSERPEGGLCEECGEPVRPIKKKKLSLQQRLEQRAARLHSSLGDEAYTAMGL